MSKIDLYKGDCLEIMDRLISDGVVVDAIITDPPYGTTACKWDSIIPFDEMWKRLNKLIKPNGAIVLFGSEPFSSLLRVSNLKNYKYDWIWDKKIPSGMCNAKIMPMKQSENISVFIKGKNFYNPQMTKRDIPIKSGGMTGSLSAGAKGLKKLETKVYDTKYPTTHLVFDKVRKGSLHPTQKPVELMKYLIRTYTNKGETVLDFTMGSGTTGVAVEELNRDEDYNLSFYGIELDEGYFNISKERIEKVKGEIK